jgi:hypothetical protein
MLFQALGFRPIRGLGCGCRLEDGRDDRKVRSHHQIAWANHRGWGLGHLVAAARWSARGQRRNPVAAGPCGLVDELFAAKLAQVVRRLADGVVGVGGAGCETWVPFFGYMAGALQSGARAAREIIALESPDALT